MPQSIRVLFALVFSCFFTHVAQAAFPNSIGDYGIRKSLKMTGLTTVKTSLSFYVPMMLPSPSLMQTAMEDGVSVAKYTLFFNKKNTAHCFSSTQITTDALLIIEQLRSAFQQVNKAISGDLSSDLIACIRKNL